MPASALALALAAAAVHATWNLLLSGAEDTHAATALAAITGVLLFAPVAALTWRMHAAAVPYMAASSVLELLYLVLLASAYSLAELGFVYPLARGSGPVLVLVISAAGLGASVSLGAAAGVVLVGLGVVLVRGLRRAQRGRETLLALAVGGCIAGYTLVDKRGIVHAAPVAYMEVVFLVTASVYLAGVWRHRGTAALRAALRPRTLVAGAGFFGSYALVLLALRLAPAAGVAAVRESSVLMATLALAVSGRERVRARQLAGAVAVVAGIALISLL